MEGSDSGNDIHPDINPNVNDDDVDLAGATDGQKEDYCIKVFQETDNIELDLERAQRRDEIKTNPRLRPPGSTKAEKNSGTRKSCYSSICPK